MAKRRRRARSSCHAALKDTEVEDVAEGGGESGEGGVAAGAEVARGDSTLSLLRDTGDTSGLPNGVLQLLLLLLLLKLDSRR